MGSIAVDRACCLRIQKDLTVRVRCCTRGWSHCGGISSQVHLQIDEDEGSLGFRPSAAYEEGDDHLDPDLVSYAHMILDHMSI